MSPQRSRRPVLPSAPRLAALGVQPVLPGNKAPAGLRATTSEQGPVPWEKAHDAFPKLFWQGVRENGRSTNCSTVGSKDWRTQGQYCVLRFMVYRSGLNRNTRRDLLLGMFGHDEAWDVNLSLSLSLTLSLSLSLSLILSEGRD